MVNAGIIPHTTNDIVPTVDRHFRRVRSSSDRAVKKSISYWLNIEYDFAFGYAHDFKTGQELRFNTYSDDKNLTRADLERIKSIIKIKQLEEDKLTAERHAKIAQRANKVLANTVLGVHTPYTTRKQIDHSKTLSIGENVIVPIYEFGISGNLELVSWQTIYPDGIKKFPFGGKKKGCFHIIGQIEPSKPIIICEGYATGQTIYEATSHAVVVALDAGNLFPVAKKFRDKYQKTSIIIGADNDISGTGQKAAQEIQKKISNTTVILPLEAGKDFNDIGIEETRHLFGIQESDGEDLISIESQQLAVSDYWQSNLITDTQRRIIPHSIQNCILYLLEHEDWKGCFVYDEFKQQTFMVKCPPFMIENEFKVQTVNDRIITQTAATLERYGLNSGVDRTAQAINVVAYENKINSAQNYFNSLQWDGEERLRSLFIDYFHAKEEDPQYLAMIGKKWMTAAVKRIFEAGCKFDHVLILESQKQGLFKSSALRTLASFNGECYHTDSVSVMDYANKDAIKRMQGNLIIELAELSGFNKQDDNAIKNWFTQQVDEVRLPYERIVSKFPRQFTFVATTNLYDYLKDPTGNRRYWPVTVGGYIDIDGLEKVKEQLWAEAVWLYKKGYYIGVTPSENDMADIERAKRLSRDAWDSNIMKIVQNLGLDEFRIDDILDKMDLKTTEKNDKSIRRISGILKMNNYENRPTWDSKAKRTVRVWSKADV